jgi:hypothetical protein
MFQGSYSVAVAFKWACFAIYLRCHACFAARRAANLQRSSIALLGYSESAVAVSDAFGVMIAGELVSAIVAGAAELVAVRFSHWQRFFAAFLEIPGIVSMVTKNGKPQRLRLKVTVCRGLCAGDCVDMRLRW